jgi:hypothetical protein
VKKRVAERWGTTSEPAAGQMGARPPGWEWRDELGTGLKASSTSARGTGPAFSATGSCRRSPSRSTRPPSSPGFRVFAALLLGGCVSRLTRIGCRASFGPAREWTFGPAMKTAGAGGPGACRTFSPRCGHSAPDRRLLSSGGDDHRNPGRLRGPARGGGPVKAREALGMGDEHDHHAALRRNACMGTMPTRARSGLGGARTPSLSQSRALNTFAVTSSTRGSRHRAGCAAALTARRVGALSAAGARGRCGADGPRAPSR